MINMNNIIQVSVTTPDPTPGNPVMQTVVRWNIRVDPRAVAEGNPLHWIAGQPGSYPNELRAESLDRMLILVGAELHREGYQRVPCPKCGNDCGYWNKPQGCGA
jgi:hypothetical protein